MKMVAQRLPKGKPLDFQTIGSQLQKKHDVILSQENHWSGQLSQAPFAESTPP
jgi:hypothetical protein